MIEVYASPAAPGLERLLDVLRRGSVRFRVRDAGPVDHVRMRVVGRESEDLAPEMIVLAVGIPIETCWQPPQPGGAQHRRFPTGERFDSRGADGLDRLRLMMLRASGDVRDKPSSPA